MSFYCSDELRAHLKSAPKPAAKVEAQSSGSDSSSSSSDSSDSGLCCRHLVYLSPSCEVPAYQ